MSMEFGENQVIKCFLSKFNDNKNSKKVSETKKDGTIPSS